MAKETNKNKKIVVNEGVDNFVNSLALSTTFIILGILLTVVEDFMGDSIVNSIVRWVFVILGVAGFASSFGSDNNKIKGMGDIAMGLAFLLVALLVFSYAPVLIRGIGALLLLLLGVYGMLRGVMFFAYTAYHAAAEYARRNKRDSGHNMEGIVASILEVVSKLAALALVVAQIYQIFQGLS